jgi:hemerythrin-like domain-containing protein
MTIANTVKSLAARATMTQNDVRALLTKDHDDAKALAKQMCESTQSASRKAAFLKLKPALTAHSRAEEKVVYNALLSQRGEPVHKIANEGFVEHSLVDELLGRLAQGDVSSDMWKAEAKVLRELLEHHIEEEQSDTYAELGEHFDRETLSKMGVQFTLQKAALLKGKKTSGSRRKTASKSSTRSRGARAAAKKTASRARTRQLQGKK